MSAGADVALVGRRLLTAGRRCRPLPLAVPATVCLVLRGCSGGVSLAGDGAAEEGEPAPETVVPPDADASGDDGTDTPSEGEVDAGDALAEDGADVADAADRDCLTGEPGPVDTWLVRVVAESGVLSIASMCVAAGGEAGLAGSWGSDDSSPTDLWVARLDSAGRDFAWQTRITARSSLATVAIAPRGGAGFVVGASSGLDGGGWVFGLDPSGAVEWERRFVPQLRGLGATDDGEFVAFSGTSSGAWLTRLGDGGDVVRQQEDSARHDYRGGAVLTDGGAAVLNQEVDFMDPDGWIHYRMVLTRPGAAGGGWLATGPGWEWSELGGVSPAASVLPLPAGGVLVSMWSGAPFANCTLASFDAGGGASWASAVTGAAIAAVGGASGDPDLPMAGGTGEVAWVGALDSGGAIRWQRSVDLGSGSPTTAWSTARAPDGGLLFLGGSGGDRLFWLGKFGPAGEFGGTCPALACPHAVAEPTCSWLAASSFPGFEVGGREPAPGYATAMDADVARVERVCPE